MTAKMGAPDLEQIVNIRALSTAFHLCQLPLTVRVSKKTVLLWHVQEGVGSQFQELWSIVIAKTQKIKREHVSTMERKGAVAVELNVQSTLDTAGHAVFI